MIDSDSSDSEKVEGYTEEDPILLLRHIISNAQKLLQLDLTSLDQYRVLVGRLGEAVKRLESSHPWEEETTPDRKRTLQLQIYSKNLEIKSLIDKIHLLLMSIKSLEK